MGENELKKIAEGLIDTFNYAGEESKKLYDDGLKIEIKKDKSPVSNGDLRVNDILSKKISELTPNIRIISEETVDIKVKNKSKIFAQKFHKKKQTFVSQKRKTIGLPYYFTTGGGGGKYHAKQRREAA